LCEYQSIERANDDWYVVEIRDKKFIAFGDTSKLDFIINYFKQLVTKK